MMKRNYLSWVLVTLIACALYGCKSSSSKTTATLEAEQAAQADELVTDSILFHQEQDSTITCQWKVDYPTEPDSLSMAVRDFLNQELGRLYLPLQNIEEGTKKYTAYSGSLNNGKVVVDYYGNGTMKYLQEQGKEMWDYGMPRDIKLTFDASIRKTAETDSYITYQSISYVFLGGAHGSASDYSTNIIKATGKVLTQSVDTLKRQELQPILRKGILKYLQEEQTDAVVTDATLNDFLFIDKGIIPLPVHTPYLAKDGVHFIYQQYEIGPYAMGIVSFTVPYEEIKSFLTAEAQKLTK